MKPGLHVRPEARPLIEEAAQEIAELLAQAEASAASPPSEKAKAYFEGARDGLKAALEKIERLIADS